MRTRSDDLTILLAVADSGGFSLAAEQLDIQVARVSRSISKLEQQLGVTLFNRTTRRVELTIEGRQFVESVRGSLQHIRQAEEALTSKGTLPKGKLRVDAASPFLFHQLIPLIRGFRLAYPHIDLELTSNEGFIDLIEKRTDVAIRIGKLADSSLHARALGTSDLHIVASADYLSEHGIPNSIKELSQHQIIGFHQPKHLNQWPLQGCDSLMPTIAASNGETVRQLALAGNGIACLSGFMVNSDISAGRLVPLFQSHKKRYTDQSQVHAVFYKSSNVARRISAFIDYIQPRLTL
ncbi:LysR family transcriptional regulator [Shewanella gelidii]|uniref:LysR family transcriptional regulator n=1 Tax=Shewanella gelidii TaxID=1642821 RepID=A0A917JKU4_9GAMM|nr:LysR family transcriptional regulator [Shewanella gelidii]MCL1096551.1 LysR family transcriptional regulator [Shewanella gelidii]GGI68340.1 LysR family transcriptional regulator [Shewanella gelidii]